VTPTLGVAVIHHCRVRGSDRRCPPRCAALAQRRVPCCTRSAYRVSRGLGPQRPSVRVQTYDLATLFPRPLT
jgi:hypothetical protein